MRPSSCDHALVLVLRQVERRDDLARLRDLVGARRERRVAGLDLVRMDQGLAVEAHVARLRAFAAKPSALPRSL